MALIACPECNAQVSNQAKACPSCGATPPKPRKSRALLYALLGLPIIFLAWGFSLSSDPYAEAKYQARESISTCWNEQKRQSMTPSEARFIAGACEKMERDFRTKYGHSP